MKEEKRRRRWRRQVRKESEEEAIEAGVPKGPGFAGDGSVSGDVMLMGSKCSGKFFEKRVLETKIFNVSGKALLGEQSKSMSRSLHDESDHLKHHHHHNKHVVVSSVPFSQSMKMGELLNEEQTRSAALQGGPAERTSR